MFEHDFIELGERVATAFQTPPRNPNSGSQLIAAFEAAWSAIQRENPDTPDVLIITGSGAVPFGLILGHFAESSWEQDARLGKRHEMFVGGEGLARGAREVMATLLHEAGHGVAMVRKIQDTSRQGRWHNKRFKAIGEELGLELKQSPDIGWSLTTMPDRTAKLYRDEIEELQKAIAYHRRNPFADLFGKLGGDDDDGPSWGDKVKTPKAPRPPRPPRSIIACQCSPARRLRMAQADFDLGAVHCAVCDSDFEERIVDAG